MCSWDEALNRHCFSASTTYFSKTGWALTVVAAVTVPSGATVMRVTVVPCILWSLAARGYGGATNDTIEGNASLSGIWEQTGTEAATSKPMITIALFTPSTLRRNGAENHNCCYQPIAQPIRNGALRRGSLVQWRFDNSYLPLTSPELSEVRERPWRTPLASFAVGFGNGG